jgi:cytochrome c biogenesis protein CcmG/thiol:disulfide interchange protein DsbE
MNRRTLLLAPLGIAAVAGVAFTVLLRRMGEGRYDPRGLPSVLIGKRLPAFALPGVHGDGFSDADIAAVRRPVLVNFFASWCAPCVEEAPVLADVSQAGVPIWGIAYKDQPDATDAFLARHGNPYVRLARDQPGLVAIDWGVTGVPETFLIDAEAIVRWRLADPLSPQIVEHELQPLLRKYV